MTDFVEIEFSYKPKEFSEANRFVYYRSFLQRKDIYIVFSGLILGTLLCYIIRR